MTGVSFSRGGYHRIGKRATNGAGGYTIHRADHWLFDGTGIGYGDVLGAEAVTVGYECDGCAFTYVDGLPVPTHEDGTPEYVRDPRHRPRRPLHPRRRPPARRPRTSRARSSSSPPACSATAPPSRSSGSRPATPCSAPTPHRRGGIVVTSGSTDWAHGLAGRDAQVEQITRNLLDRLSGGHFG